MGSSTTSEEQDHYNYAPPAAPPPTPASHSHLISTSAPAIDNLSQLFNRLPPTLSLSLPKRRSSPISPPIISLPELSLRFSRAFELGFFQLSGHNVPFKLANKAEFDSLSLFRLSREKKLHHFPQNWPLGYDDNDDDDNEEERLNKASESFCFDSSCYGELDELKVTSLREFTQEMEKVGLEIIEAMSCALGFDNPTRICSLMWVSEETPGNKQVMSGKMYPYVVGLQYQLRGQKSMMLADSGSVSVSTQVGSLLVTLGDIAQVWSNGKLKKVRGRPIPSLEEGNNSAKSTSMTLLLTLPLDSTVSTLIPKSIDSHNDEDGGDDDRDGNEDIAKNQRLFKSFSFEDYAWRMYYEQHVLKDPLDRYRA